jgi:hypothetical protein
MRDEIRRAFEESTQAPHPGLAAAIRARTKGRTTAARAADRRVPMSLLLAGAAAVLVVLFGAGLYLVPGGRGGTLQPAGGSHTPPIATASPSATPSPAPTASPSPAAASPSPSGATSELGPFSCATVSGGGTAGVAMTDVRVGTQAGYDRFVINYDGPVPTFRVTLQPTTTFTQDASGRPLTLQGSRGILVRVEHGSGGAGYQGPRDLKPNYPALKEAQLVGDFEGVTQWGLGIAANSCFRVLTLTGPDRLVIDVQHP